jgi:hypothetical protein
MPDPSSKASYETEDRMTKAQRAAYEVDPMVQYKPEWVALGNEDLAEALHRIHDGQRRDHRNDRGIDCHQCCYMARAAAKTIAKRLSCETDSR